MLAGGVYVIWSEVQARRTAEKYERGYSQINIGDSKQVVLNLMGKPSKITGCVHPWFSDQTIEAEYRSRCKELYRYEVRFPVDYTVSFDKDGTVINKTTAVSS
jgi:hypothetical protein